ncbi:mitochondrial-processing peptidase subunit alpha-like [Zingiber officinale]|uniref:mitochondrial-processing peptidase subunit alpha-like n=1 Tax=Zingiber officinale TaxID=94328 RepID=UPI001C4B64F2|nr:mitochondrial-processing peptidase subunit alpha-like [Zingiber officinale]
MSSYCQRKSHSATSALTLSQQELKEEALQPPNLQNIHRRINEILAASGVEHKELVSLAEPLLSDLPKVPRPQEPKSVYVGGEHRCQSDLPSTHIALAFEIPGGWRQEKEAMAATVLQVLMGGGGSFSTGGPGKGMHSRLCTLPTF